jgi:uncharacterized protein (TIGR03089 family)
VDYAAEVRSHGDVFLPPVQPEASRPAVLTTAGAAHTHAGLLDGFAALQGDAQRLLVPAADGLEAALARCLGAWTTDGSVVLVHPDVEVTDKLLSTERVDAS